MLLKTVCYMHFPLALKGIYICLLYMFAMWLWVKIKSPEERRCSSMFPFTRVLFWGYPIFDPQPCGKKKQQQTHGFATCIFPWLEREYHFLSFFPRIFPIVFLYVYLFFAWQKSRRTTTTPPSLPPEATRAEVRGKAAQLPAGWAWPDASGSIAVDTEATPQRLFGVLQSLEEAPKPTESKRVAQKLFPGFVELPRLEKFCELKRGVGFVSSCL